MDCEKVRNLLFEYNAGRGTPEERAEIEMHLAECEACQPALDCAQAEELMVADARGAASPEQREQLWLHLAACAKCRELMELTRKTVDVLEANTGEPLIKMCTLIAERAISEQASDIHIEPGPGNTRVRYRIDGVLHDVCTLPDYVLEPLVGHIHALGRTNPLEMRVPQFGSITVKHEDKTYNLRATHMPSFGGPRVTLRILPTDTEALELGQMYIAEDNLAAMRRLLRQPTGLMVISGPAGSGKTTTAYACLREVVSPEISVFAIEDPVAMVLENVTQISINPAQGLDYRAALRAVMQSDPDVIFVGDMGELDTALQVCELALTGHMVVACLHAEDATTTITRLVELGVPAHALASSLVGVVSQRLVRRVCEECKVEYELPPDEIAFLHAAGVADVPRALWRGAGCDHCRSTGYRGRAALNEVLVLDRELAAAIAEGRYVLETGRAAVATSLMQDGAAKAVAGVTTVAEARRVTVR